MTTSLTVRDSDREVEFLLLEEVEIVFKTKHPRYPVQVKIGRGEAIIGSKEFSSQDGNSLLWRAVKHVPPNSSLDVIVKESQTFKWKGKREFAAVHIESVDPDQSKVVTKEDVQGLISLRLAFEAPVKAAIAVRKEAVDAAGLLKNKPLALEKLGRARSFVQGVKKFGDVLGDVHPAAKAATIAFDMLYEKFEKQEKVHKDASELIDDLQDFLPFIEAVDRTTLTNESAKKSIKDFLYVFKETCEFIVEYSSTGVLGDLMSSHGSKIDELKSDFKKVKSRYDWSIKTDTWKINLKIEKIRDNSLLKLLQVPSPGPAGRESYRTDKSCLGDTRASTIERISQWAKTSDRKLLWIYGSAGCGKTAIANSVAHLLDTQRLLAGCFFCSRDDLDLRDTSKVIPSLAAHLAVWHQPYYSKLLSVVQRDKNKIASNTLSEQFDLLIKDPLLGLSSDEGTVSPDPLVVIVDGLDECGKARNQRSQLARILVQIAELVPWLKLFISSRPFPEFNQVFQGSSHILEKLDLDTAEDATADITLFAQHRAKLIAQENGLEETWLSEEQIAELVRRSRGQFVWMSVVLDFIESHTDVEYAVDVVMSAPELAFDKATGDVRRLCVEKLEKTETELNSR